MEKSTKFANLTCRMLGELFFQNSYHSPRFIGLQVLVQVHGHGSIMVIYITRFYPRIPLG